ncbi:hypothetical protein [Cryobacterium sp. MDB2-33-2]|uniref:hypothetical protein n=1 Tax=Cryobacterium sp. MDB2-33-2 TaxID=1259179 RepID=UPI00106C9B12|nr:hypothetical protein [Cryobacterium sp. MDB2-33-2]TFC10556.1 hypothetical protein E3O59_03445 [Cryobacterium sp. MDB2-33-2]
MSKINWSTIGEKAFNELVEALLLRQQKDIPGTYARAIDGRGGDGGIDVDVRATRTDQLIGIFQLKHFPEGFSNGFSKTRRDQIRNSFRVASELNPPVWTLVVPCNGAVKERKFVSALRGTGTTRIRFLGATELNLILAKYSDLHDWATRDAAISALRIVDRESHALARPDDLNAEIDRLSIRSEARSSYWGINFSRQGQTTVQEIYAKRPDAAAREPIAVNVTAAFGDEHSELRKALEDTIAYGASKELVLPSEIIQEISMVGPEWIAGAHGPGEVRLVPIPSVHRGETVYLKALSGGGKTLAAITGTLENMTSGPSGISLDATFPGGMTQHWRFPAQETVSSFEISVDLSGQSGRAMARALDFLDALPFATELLLELMGISQLAKISAAKSRIDDGTGLREFISDLAFIESATNVEFAFPTGSLPTARDRIEIRVARRVLEGKCVVSPFEGELTATLTGELTEEMEDVLLKPGQFLITYEGWSLDAMAARVELGEVTFFHPRVTIAAGQGHLDALRRGEGAGRELRLLPERGEPFTMYNPSLFGERSPFEPEPWGITGVEEHPKFNAMLSHAQEKRDGLLNDGL